MNTVANAILHPETPCTVPDYQILRDYDDAGTIWIKHTRPGGQITFTARSRIPLTDKSAVIPEPLSTPINVTPLLAWGTRAKSEPVTEYVDLVCGQSVHLHSDTPRLDQGDDTYYFCSHHCRRSFLYEERSRLWSAG